MFRNLETYPETPGSSRRRLWPSRISSLEISMHATADQLELYFDVLIIFARETNTWSGLKSFKATAYRFAG